MTEQNTAAAAPLVTVVIPCYDPVHYLPEALASVAAQSHPHVETVVVDDGSPRDVAALVERFPGVRYVRRENGGPSAARNTGLEHARGEYVVFLDCDDRLMPDAIETGVRHLEANPALAFAAGRTRNFNDEGTPVWSQPEHPPMSDVLEQLLVDNCRIYPVASVFRRSSVEAVGGYDASYRWVEDWELNLRLAWRWPVLVHNRVVGEYRKHPSSLSRNHTGMLKHVVRLLAAQRPHTRGHARREAARRLGLARGQDWFGGLVAEQVRGAVHARDLSAVAGLSWTLLRFAPNVLSDSLLGSIRRVTGRPQRRSD